MKLGGFSSDIKVTSLLVFRLALFVILLGASLLFLPLSSFLLSFFALYGLVSLAFLLALLLPGQELFRRWFGLISLSQLFLEVFIEALLVNHTGGITSPLAALFFLSIVSASLHHQLVGTILVASWASLLYAGTVLSAAGWNWLSILTLKAFPGIYHLKDEHFYILFIYLCSFYLVAFSSGYLAQRLKIKAELLLSASRQLRRVRMETDDILRHLHSGLVTIDNTGRVVYFNRAAEEILQMKNREVQGKGCEEVFGQRMPELAKELLAGLELKESELRREIEITDRQGKKIPIGINTTLLQEEEGIVSGVTALFQDLTRIKELEEELRTKDRLAAIGELSAGIAHEIRNPLASISGSVEVLKQELHLEGDNLNLLELILKETQRLNRILTEFLNFARIRSPYFGKVDLVPVTEEVIELVQKHSNYRPEIKIENQLPLHPVWIKGEENHVKQILLNLLMNAVEAMEGKTGKITISNPENAQSESSEPVLVHNNWILIAVSDQGKGMTNEEQGRMFLPFYSTKKAGTGLGLSIVQRLVDSLEGRIECHSELGKGTSMAVYLQKFQAETEKPSPVVQPGPLLTVTD